MFCTGYEEVREEKFNPLSTVKCVQVWSGDCQPHKELYEGNK
jgi:hypothetical protein